MNADEYGKQEAERFTSKVHSLDNSDQRRVLEMMFALAWQSGFTSGAQAAGEKSLERYYGGGEPVTLDEQHAAAWEEHRKLHR